MQGEVSSPSNRSDRECRVLQAKAALKRIASHEGVEGYVVADPRKGKILHSVGFNGDARRAKKYSDVFFQLTSLAESTVRTIDKDDQLTFFRVGACDKEILIAPDINHEYVILVVQDRAPQN